MAAAAESLGQPGADVYTLNTADGFGFTLLHRRAQRAKLPASRTDQLAIVNMVTQTWRSPDNLTLTISGCHG